jgi:hypothetical protein
MGFFFDKIKEDGFDINIWVDLKKVIKQYDNNSFGDFMFFSLMIQ